MIKLTMLGVLENTEVLVFTLSDTIELTVLLTVSKCWAPLRCLHSH